MDADTEDRERRIIADAIARGHTMARWIAVIISLLFIASGLWWAGILVLVVTTFELPRLATQRYARRRGLELSIPSGQEVEKTSLSGLAFGVVFIPIVSCARCSSPRTPSGILCCRGRGGPSSQARTSMCSCRSSSSDSSSQSRGSSVGAEMPVLQSMLKLSDCLM